MSLIKPNQLPLDGVTLEENAGEVRQVPGTDSSSNSTIYVVAANSFVTGNVIRHNGSAWVLALASTVAGARGTWMVVSATGSDFTAQQVGRITLTGHGFTPGDVLYLSSTVSGGLTAIKPVGSLTLPLGFYLPVAVVEDANTLQLLGTYPQYNPVLAQYVHSGATAASITFSNLDFNAYGGTLEFETVQSTPSTSSGAALDLRVNGLTTTYFSILNFDNLTALDRSETVASDSRFSLATNPSSSSTNASMFCKGTITRAAAGALSERVRILANYIEPLGGNGFSGGVLTTGQTNITSLTFFDHNNLDFRFISGQGDYVKLFWRPEGI